MKSGLAISLLHLGISSTLLQCSQGLARCEGEATAPISDISTTSTARLVPAPLNVEAFRLTLNHSSKWSVQLWVRYICKTLPDLPQVFPCCRSTISYRVPRLLAPLLPPVEDGTLPAAATEALYQQWGGEAKDTIEEQALELYRLAKLAQNFDCPG